MTAEVSADPSIPSFSDPEVNAPDAPKEYVIRPSDHFFSKTFTVLYKDWPSWVISTNKYCTKFFDWRTHYTIENANTGKPIASATKNYGLSLKGIWNLSFMGLFRPHSLADFDVYDQSGKPIGFIDGRVMTLSKARFDFHDKEGNVTAYAAQEGTEIKIRDANNDAIIGYMKRIFETGTPDSWKVSLLPKVDTRIAMIFAAYVVTHQAAFVKDQ